MNELNNYSMISDIYGCSVILLITSIICFLPTALLSIIHLRQPLLKEGFFNIVFGTIINELLMHLLIMINSITIMVNISNESKENNIMHYILGFCNDLFFSTHIAYNLVMITSFIKKSKTKEPLINKDIAYETSRVTLNLKSQSFIHIHVLSIIMGVLHAIASVSTLSLDTFTIPFSYLSMEKIGNYVFIYFIYHILYFIISIFYCSVSWNKFKISNHIRLKNYSWYCVYSSTLWLIIPICFIIVAFGNEINMTALRYSATVIYALLMLSLMYFHFKCYYVSFLLKVKGFSMFSTCCFAMKLLFCIVDVPELNFIDFNSAYIYHSLCTESDLLSVDQGNETIIEEEDGDNNNDNALITQELKSD